MRLTFKGFLRTYCRQLSGLETDSLKKLCREAAGDAPRVAEPLFLFALEQGKLDRLLELSKGSWMEGDYRALAESARSAESAAAFLKSGGAPKRYAKVWDAYVAKRDAIERDRRISALMRQKTVEALESGGVTPYRVCKELGLNPGNVYAYLKGDVAKVSRDTARRIMDFATSAAGR